MFAHLLSEVVFALAHDVTDTVFYNKMSVTLSLDECSFVAVAIFIDCNSGAVLAAIFVAAIVFKAAGEAQHP